MTERAAVHSLRADRDLDGLGRDAKRRGQPLFRFGDASTWSKIRSTDVSAASSRSGTPGLPDAQDAEAPEHDGSPRGRLRPTGVKWSGRVSTSRKSCRPVSTSVVKSVRQLSNRRPRFASYSQSLQWLAGA
jgi:hypothetical protein